MTYFKQNDVESNKFAWHVKEREYVEASGTTLAARCGIMVENPRTREEIKTEKLICPNCEKPAEPDKVPAADKKPVPKKKTKE